MLFVQQKISRSFKGLEALNGGWWHFPDTSGSNFWLLRTRVNKSSKGAEKFLSENFNEQDLVEGEWEIHLEIMTLNTRPKLSCQSQSLSHTHNLFHHNTHSFSLSRSLCLSLSFSFLPYSSFFLSLSLPFSLSRSVTRAPIILKEMKLEWVRGG